MRAALWVGVAFVAACSSSSVEGSAPTACATKFAGNYALVDSLESKSAGCGTVLVKQESSLKIDSSLAWHEDVQNQTIAHSTGDYAVVPTNNTDTCILGVAQVYTPSVDTTITVQIQRAMVKRQDGSLGGDSFTKIFNKADYDSGNHDSPTCTVHWGTVATPN